MKKPYILALSALAVAAGISAPISSANAVAVTDQTRLTTLKSRGDAEITRRLSSIDKLQGIISGMTKLSTADKASLSSEVTSTNTGLSSLKSTLDGETSLANARTDVKSIYTEYRVYALVTPKVHLANSSDAQQLAATRLTTLSQKLQTAITAKKTAGKDTASLQSMLDDMTAKTASANTVAMDLATKIMALQPTDYNTDHAVAKNYRDQLKTNHQTLQAAQTDAKSVISGLKNL